MVAPSTMGAAEPPTCRPTSPPSMVRSSRVGRASSATATPTLLPSKAAVVTDPSASPRKHRPHSPLPLKVAEVMLTRCVPATARPAQPLSRNTTSVASIKVRRSVARCRKRVRARSPARWRDAPCSRMWRSRDDHPVGWSRLWAPRPWHPLGWANRARTDDSDAMPGPGDPQGSLSAGFPPGSPPSVNRPYIRGQIALTRGDTGMWSGDGRP